MLNSSEVIIIGGGVIGCSAAYYLAKNNVKVTVLESNIIGNGASCRNAGGVRQSGRDDREIPLAMYAAQKLWPNLNEELGVDVEYYKKGNLRLGKTEEHKKILQSLAERCRQVGLGMELIDRKEIEEICPYVSHDVSCATWCPTDGHANPLKTTLGFYRKARQLGVRFITGEQVIKIEKVRGKAEKVITQNGNTYTGDTILLASGFASRAIANTVGIDIPLQKVFDECLVTEAMPPYFEQMLGTADADFYGHQSSHGSFVFGGDSGFERFHKNCDDNVDSTSTTSSCVTRSIIGYFPILKDAKIVRHWSGWLDKCADGGPVIDRVSEVPGMVLAAGFSGHGFGISPTVGLALSQIILNQPPCCDLSQFKYDRFKAKA